ncbi:carboxymuconolactone decarboxylase family protein [Klebsiella pneumoniae subsp. pneumoniae]|nr:carboxymuconolactone decarboxylase family protein [Klebsiella pneumoniae subsp. pneumoniae]
MKGESVIEFSGARPKSDFDALLTSVINYKNHEQHSSARVIMSKTRVTPWQDKDPVPADLLRAMQARRPNGELIGIDRVLLKSVPLATGWNELLSRVRADFSLELIYLELIMLRVAVLNGAQFEWRVHYPAYLQAGGTEERLKR